MGITFGMMLAIKAFTLFFFVQVSETTGETISNIATAYEANPLFMWAIQLENMSFIIGTIIMPASAIAIYIYMRRKAVQGKLDLDVLNFFVTFAFFSLLINIVNDGAILAGKVIGGLI